jgi:hypothetical protein
MQIAFSVRQCSFADGALCAREQKRSLSVTRDNCWGMDFF